MIRKPFLLKVFDAANMQRWNDKIHPVELRELDKQAHKMIIAYILGKFEEENNQDIDWREIIEGGIFEFLQRLIITDLKPQLFYRIKEDPDKYKRLNEWVYKQIQPIISPIEGNFCERFRDYFSDTNKEELNRRILGAAHFYATKWEFDIIERANSDGYEIAEIKTNLQKKQEEYYDLRWIQQLALYSNHRDFIELCGQLRFQVRWSHLYMVPRVSVLVHMLIVAIVAYLFSLEANACRKRCINNYFTGLFHDLPEVLTRDIINPVKRSVRGLGRIIKRYEKEEMKRIYNLIPKEWHPEIKMFTEDEFKSIVTIKGKIERKNSDEISESYNEDKYNPRDGEIVKAADHLAAFIEAYLAIKNGITSQELERAKNSLREKYRDKIISTIRLGEIYADFD